MENIGARLKKIRLEKGLTLEEMQKKTKIHLNILKAIEEDSIVNISPVYIKGFLKIYCNSLGVNPGDYTFSYKESVKPPAEVKTVNSVNNKENNPAPRVNTEALLSALIKFVQEKIKIILFIVIGFLFILGLFNLGKFAVLKIKSLPKKEKVEKPHFKKPVIPPAPKHERKVFSKPQAPEEVTAVKPSKTAEEPARAIRLGIRAKEDCWIQVKSDGKIIFQNNLKKGRFESWQAKEKIELSLGNAGAAELEVNGKFIPSLGRRGQSIKNILITKDGLSASR